MNQKQLTNVLVKIVGLLVLAENLGGVISAVLTLVQLIVDSAHEITRRNSVLVWAYPLTHLIQPVIGLCLILGSEWVTDKLFPKSAE